MIKINIQKRLVMAGGEALLKVDTEISRESFVALYGRSGAGKTTLLRILAGLLEPEKGIIEVDGRCWLNTDRKIRLPVQQRQIGFVFQDFALFPHMTVRENLRYALKPEKDPGLVSRMLAMVDLEQLADRKPAMLSGGQRQRVALIRALMRKPGILLLDEPFSSLDAEMRQELQDQISALHRQFNLTTLLVSHDMAEIYRIADRVIWLDEGKVLRSGPPDALFGNVRLSSKIRLTGKVLRVAKSGVVSIVEVAAGNTVIKVVVTAGEAEELHPGDTVGIFSKAFNPVIRKI
ncbi:ATP-binding cassette domain-containing protein [Compostibacter hankyongensis]|uniref:Sulfate/molybdate ABC transporter ATP-binding protein n=1 Tax=Compostibacter hankyongensis TaxID=1007089 RepID=A0ABP8FLH4_9BACT